VAYADVDTLGENVITRERKTQALTYASKEDDRKENREN
jgi:hypothetical protein